MKVIANTATEVLPLKSRCKGGGPDAGEENVEKSQGGPANGKEPVHGRSAERDYATGQGKRKPSGPSPKRSKAMTKRLKREGRSAASHSALSRHAKRVARKRRGKS